MHEADLVKLNENNLPIPHKAWDPLTELSKTHKDMMVHSSLKGYFKTHTLHNHFLRNNYILVFAEDCKSVIKVNIPMIQLLHYERHFEEHIELIEKRIKKKEESDVVKKDCESMESKAERKDNDDL